MLFNLDCLKMTLISEDLFSSRKDKTCFTTEIITHFLNTRQQKSLKLLLKSLSFCSYEHVGKAPFSWLISNNHLSNLGTKKTIKCEFVCLCNSFSRFLIYSRNTTNTFCKVSSLHWKKRYLKHADRNLFCLLLPFFPKHVCVLYLLSKPGEIKNANISKLPYKNCVLLHVSSHVWEHYCWRNRKEQCSIWKLACFQCTALGHTYYVY